MAAGGKTVCRHCGAGKVNCPKGLCWSCYYRPGVRDLYPSTSKFARRGVSDFNGRAALPEPTTALPGTPEKVVVLELRARLRQQLWHPDDARHEVQDDLTPPRFQKFPKDRRGVTKVGVVGIEL